MTVPESIQLLVAIQTLVMGASHIIQPRVWVDFFVKMRGFGHAGVFVNGFLSLWFGSLIVVFHPLWTWPEVVITLLGWTQVVKASVAFLAPAVSMKGLQRVSPDRSNVFVIGGVGLLAVSAVAWYLVLS